MFGIIRLIRRALFGSPRLPQPSPTVSAPPSAQPHVTHLRKAVKHRAKTAAALRASLDSLPEVSVEQVLDGDSVVVSRGWEFFEIRLDSIDCPEDGQPWGETARYGLIKLIGGRSVRLEEHGIDPYGRVLATLYVYRSEKDAWINVNERMVTLGHAWVMRRFYDHLPHDRKYTLNRLENWARSKKVGLWKTRDPIPPWRWRRRDNELI